MRIAGWSTGYCRGFGGSEQMVNALLRRFRLEGLDTLLIADGDLGRKVFNPYFPSLPDEVEVYVDTFPNPLLCSRRPALFIASLFKYARAALKLQPSHFVYAGRLHPDKRVALLVELFKECIDAGCAQPLYYRRRGRPANP